MQHVLRCCPRHSQSPRCRDSTGPECVGVAEVAPADHRVDQRQAVAGSTWRLTIGEKREKWDAHMGNQYTHFCVQITCK